MEHPKIIWLVTYGAACISITHDMLAEYGWGVHEVYTLTQRDFKYTLIRSAGKVRPWFQWFHVNVCI